jgi:hypothetical protein
MGGATRPAVDTDRDPGGVGSTPGHIAGLLVVNRSDSDIPLMRAGREPRTAIDLAPPARARWRASVAILAVARSGAALARAYAVRSQCTEDPA